MKLENSGEVQVGVIQISKEEVSRRQVKDICEALRTNSLSVLGLRECSLQDGDFKRLIKAISVCDGLLQLNFNVNVVNSDERVNLLAKCLRRTKSLKSLYLHGSDLSGENAEILCHSLRRHPSLISLDLGDCKLTDESMEYIIPLLEPKGRFQGLVELGLSGNTLVTSAGWCRLFQALALCRHTCRLSSLYLDYCPLGNKALTCLATALASLDTVRTVDLENTNITDEGAQFLLYLAENKKPNSLQTINLLGNGLDPMLIEAIQTRLMTSPTPSTVESDSDSEYEMRMTGTEILKDPAKIQALETLTRALNAYSRTFDSDRDGRDVLPGDEGMIDKQEEEGQESSPVDLNTADQPQKMEGQNGDAVPIETQDDQEQLETASQVSEISSKGAKSSLSSLSEAEDDFDDVIEADRAKVDFAEQEDQGEFLREIPIMQNYSVIQPVKFLSRASAGYLF